MFQSDVWLFPLLLLLVIVARARSVPLAFPVEEVVHQQSLYVDQRVGDDASECITWNQPCKTISGALIRMFAFINASMSGDHNFTIFVNTDIYLHEDVSVSAAWGNSIRGSVYMLATPNPYLTARGSDAIISFPQGAKFGSSLLLSVTDTFLMSRVSVMHALVDPSVGEALMTITAKRAIFDHCSYINVTNTYVDDPDRNDVRNVVRLRDVLSVKLISCTFKDVVADSGALSILYRKSIAPGTYTSGGETVIDGTRFINVVSTVVSPVSIVAFNWVGHIRLSNSDFNSNVGLWASDVYISGLLGQKIDIRGCTFSESTFVGSSSASLRISWIKVLYSSTVVYGSDVSIESCSFSGLSSSLGMNVTTRRVASISVPSSSRLDSATATATATATDSTHSSLSSASLSSSSSSSLAIQPLPWSSCGTICIQDANTMFRPIESQYRISKCEFGNNTVAHGGAVGFLSLGGSTGFQLSYENNVCTNNSAIEGGCIYLQTVTAASDMRANIFIRDSHFSSNFARVGGAIQSNVAPCNFTLENNVFLNNFAHVAGGAIEIMRAQILEMSDNSFICTPPFPDGAMNDVRYGQLSVVDISASNIKYSKSNEVLLDSLPLTTMSLSSITNPMTESVARVLFVRMIGSMFNNATMNTSESILPYTVARCPMGYSLEVEIEPLSSEKHYAMFVFTIYCSICSRGTYLLSGGSTYLPNVECIPCPSFGNCYGADDIFPIVGFWGPWVSLNLTIEMDFQLEYEVKYYQCPLAYCDFPFVSVRRKIIGSFTRELDTMGPSLYCNPELHRTGPLCGSCQEGYSETFDDSGTCALTSTCTTFSIVFYWFKEIVYSSVQLGFLFLTAQSVADGWLKVGIFYFQMLSVVTYYPLRWKTIFEVMKVVGFDNLIFGSSCVFRDMNVKTKLVLGFVHPSLLLAMFTLIVVIHLLFRGWFMFCVRMPIWAISRSRKLMKKEKERRIRKGKLLIWKVGNEEEDEEDEDAIVETQLLLSQEKNVLDPKRTVTTDGLELLSSLTNAETIENDEKSRLGNSNLKKAEMMENFRKFSRNSFSSIFARMDRSWIFAPIYWNVFMTLLLFSYKSAIATSVPLMHCVSLSPCDWKLAMNRIGSLKELYSCVDNEGKDGSYLFLGASFQCKGFAFYIALLFVVFVLFPFPFVVLIFRRLIRMHGRIRWKMRLMMARKRESFLSDEGVYNEIQHCQMQELVRHKQSLASLDSSFVEKDNGGSGGGSGGSEHSGVFENDDSSLSSTSSFSAPDDPLLSLPLSDSVESDISLSSVDSSVFSAATAATSTSTSTSSSRIVPPSSIPSLPTNSASQRLYGIPGLGPVARAILNAVEGCYRPGYGWWESLLLFVRLLLVSGNVLIVSPVWSLLFPFFVLIILLGADLYCKPFRKTKVQLASSISIGMLIILASQKLFYGTLLARGHVVHSTLTSSSGEPDRYRSADLFCQVVQLLFGVAVAAYLTVMCLWDSAVFSLRFFTVFVRWFRRQKSSSASGSRSGNDSSTRNDVHYVRLRRGIESLPSILKELF